MLSNIRQTSVDIVFDMTEDPQAMKTGIDSLTIGGCVFWIQAVFPNGPVQIDAQQVVRKLLQIPGSHNLIIIMAS